jgi:hypothetical protein
VLNLLLDNTPWKSRGSGCIDPHLLELSTSWRWVVTFMPLLLYPQGKRTWYPLDRRLGWTLQLVWMIWRNEKLWPYQNSNPNPSVVQPTGSRYAENTIDKKKLHGLSPRANYTYRATAACRRSDYQLLRIEGATWSAWRTPTAVFSVF